MRNSKMVWSCLLLCLFLGSSCELAKLGDPIVASDVEDEFLISPWEKLTPNGRSFEFHIQTLAEESCRNAYIENNFSVSGNQLEVSIDGIVAPQDCDPGQAPAFAAANAGNLPPRFYELTVDLKNTVVNEGQLTVSGDAYRIEMKSTAGFKLSHSELRRVPEQTIWGYITYQDLEDEAITDDFMDGLSSLAYTQTYQKGYYGYFQITGDDGKITVTDHPQTPRIKQFIFQLEDDRQAVEELVSTFRDQYKDNVGIRLFTWTGEEI